MCVLIDIVKCYHFFKINVTIYYSHYIWILKDIYNYDNIISTIKQKTYFSFKNFKFIIFQYYIGDLDILHHLNLKNFNK